MRGARARPRARRRAPRHQAPEHHRPRRHRLRPPGEAGRLRNREPRRRADPDRPRGGGRDARLHVTRAVGGHARGLRLRRLLARAHPVRVLGRREPRARGHPRRRPPARWASPCRPSPPTGPTFQTACARRSTRASSPTPTSGPPSRCCATRSTPRPATWTATTRCRPPPAAEGERKPGLAPRPAALRAGLALGLAAACVVLAGPVGVARRRPARGSPRISRPRLRDLSGARGAAGRGNRPRRRVGRRRLSGPRRRGRAHNDGAPRPRRAGLVLAADRVRRARHRASGRAPRAPSGQLGRLAWHHLRRPSSPAPRARVVDRDGRLRDRCRGPRARPREQASGDGSVRFRWCGPPASPRPCAWSGMGECTGRP